MMTPKIQPVRNMKLDISGQNRDCWLVGKWAIKTPSFRHGWFYFLQGLTCNMLEQRRWESSKHPRLARLIWAMPGGWLNVYQRYEGLKRPLIKAELDALPVFNPDPKIGNYARTQHGDIIVLDYGHCDCYVKFVESEWQTMDTRGGIVK